MRDGRRFAKGGLFVRGGKCDVVVRIPDDADPSTEINGWGLGETTDLSAPQAYGRSVTIEARGCGRKKFSGGPGGIVFRGRECLMLEIQVGERTAVAPVGLRKRCPDPPA